MTTKWMMFSPYRRGTFVSPPPLWGGIKGGGYDFMASA